MTFATTATDPFGGGGGSRPPENAHGCDVTDELARYDVIGLIRGIFHLFIVLRRGLLRVRVTSEFIESRLIGGRCA